MLSTIFLVGLVLGFGIGRVIPTAAIKTDVMAEKSNGQTIADATKPAAPVDQTPTEPTTTLATDYTAFKTAVTKDNHWTMGDPNAKVKIEEFSDFQCPFCERFYTQSYDQIIKNYVATGKVYYVFYN